MIPRTWFSANMIFLKKNPNHVSRGIAVSANQNESLIRPSGPNDENMVCKELSKGLLLIRFVSDRYYIFSNIRY